MNWLFRIALTLVPASWRATVSADLEQDAHAGRRSTLWRAGAALGIGLRLQTSARSSAMASDLCYALRSLLHARWFALGAVVTFALGIGVNVAVFSAVDRMTFRPLPYHAPQRLFVLKESNLERTQTYGTLPALWLVLGRGHIAGVEDLGMPSDAFSSQSFALTSEPGAERVLSTIPVTFNVLKILGITPVRGRGFTEDDARHKRRLVLISYTTWQRKFGGREDVFRIALWQGGTPAEIVGVLPADFLPPAAAVPQTAGLSLDDELMESATLSDRADPPILRQAPGATVASVEAALGPIVAEYERQQPPPPAGRPVSHSRAVLQPMGEAMFGYYQRYVWVVAVAAGLVLLIACVNLSSLMLVRGRSRERETAIRVALGASRARVVRSAVDEALLLSTLGAVVGITVMAWTNDALRALLPTVFLNYTVALYDSRVVAFSVGAAACCALLAGLLPGLRLSGIDVLPVLKAVSGRTQSGRLRGGASLLIVETAIGVILVAGAAMTGRSLIGLMRTDVGFNPSDLYSVGVLMPWNAQESGEARLAQYNAVLGVIRNLPGVSYAAGANVLPTSCAAGYAFGGKYAGQRWGVTDQFLETLGMRSVAGRSFTADEVAHLAPVAVLSERGAALVWPGVPPREVIGRTLNFPSEPPREVIGVVPDVQCSYARHSDPSLYVPVAPERFKFMMFAARVSPGATISAPILRARVKASVGEPLSASAGLELESLKAGLRDQRFRAVMFTTFGAVGLLLAAVGLYAVTSFDVAARRQEMGVRLSLGASPGDLSQRVLRDSVRPALMGVSIGVVLSLWAAQFLQSFLHKVDARDPWTFAIVAITLVAAAVVAAWIPARRAARTDPTEVLRAQ